MSLYKIHSLSSKVQMHQLSVCTEYEQSTKYGMKKYHKYIYQGSYDYCPAIGEKKTKVPNITEAM